MEIDRVRHGSRGGSFFLLRGKDIAEFFVNSQSRILRVPQPKLLQALTRGVSVSLPPSSLGSVTWSRRTTRFCTQHDSELDRPNNFSELQFLSSYNPGDACRHLKFGGVSTSVLPIGIAYHIDNGGKIKFMCLSNLHLAFVISFDDHHDDKPHPSFEFVDLLRPTDDGRRTNEEVEICLVGFSFPRTAIQVNRATQRHVRGVDLSTMFTPNPREPWSPSRIVKERVHSSANAWDIACLWHGDERMAERNTCLQAWLAACVAAQCSNEVINSIKVDTRLMNKVELACVSNLVAQLDLLEYYKPKEAINDFSSGEFNREGKFVIHNIRFKSRVRPSQLTRVVMTDVHGREYTGNAQGARGKQTTIRLNDNRRGIGALSTVKVLGRQELTNPEKAHDELLFHILTNKKDLRTSPFVRSIWFPTWKDIHDLPEVVEEWDTDFILSGMGLNDSQRTVVQAMVGEQPIVVTHGPPGTGKTTTIAAASRIWDLCGFPVWIVAHSNVAVKNIAETLFKKEVDFKLIVWTKEFYVEWHEHLYHEIQEKVRRSDELPADKVAMERELEGSRIILSTLSMISNPSLYDNGTFDIIPVERLVIDEASQINIFEFTHPRRLQHIFVRFQSVLQKVCFFGDPKQHRMPLPIGDFISSAVYDGRLHSQHAIKDPSCLVFVNVSPPQGLEERAGEVQTIVHLVQTYHKMNFCVITPYDAQRAAIETGLKNAELPWDSVYNLDSFQGNEADYVLVSVVRSSVPGFLASLQRMNVLLTRCRKGLIIVTSRGFLSSGGHGTLLGRLARYWESIHKGFEWIDWRDIANGTANLPGAPSHPRSAAPRMVPFSVPGASYSVAYPTDPLWPPSNRAVSQQSPNGVASQIPNLENLDHFPRLSQRKSPILPGSWAARDFPSFSIPKPRVKYSSASFVQAPGGAHAAQMTPSSMTPSSSSTKIPLPKNGAGLSTSNTRAGVQGVPRNEETSTSTHQYHRHSLLNRKSTAKEAAKKTKARVPPNPVATAPPSGKYPTTATPQPSKAKATQKPVATTRAPLHGKHQATATAQSSTGSRPLGNFIKSIVVYA
ncbi:hypothetical protein M413DRAFT_434968 [Hebeloma cylindrosporum]|uniref:DNA2/NAM7 helicase-like C-terminal domain-containing protein n=1 Tax=Hebeloma cylindrosporum TaxID=76867 RepID=A0A0C3BDG4_HEBCY|nr:hypothetical protein M413DRAFT_434968 [Hebeloma cylindrosporum h7]